MTECSYKGCIDDAAWHPHLEMGWLGYRFATPLYNSCTEIACCDAHREFLEANPRELMTDEGWAAVAEQLHDKGRPVPDIKNPRYEWRPI